MKDRKKLEVKNKKKYMIIVGVILILFWIFLKTKQDTLNYPINLYYSLTLCVTIIISIVTRKKFIGNVIVIKSYLNKFLFMGLNLLIVTTISFFIAGIVLIPFNLFNSRYSFSKEIKIVKCDITGLSDYSRNKSIFYKYKGKTSVIYNHKKIMSQIYINKDFYNYQIVFVVQEGLLDTEIINTFYVCRK